MIGTGEPQWVRALGASACVSSEHERKLSTASSEGGAPE